MNSDDLLQNLDVDALTGNWGKILGQQTKAALPNSAESLVMKKILRLEEEKEQLPEVVGKPLSWTWGDLIFPCVLHTRNPQEETYTFSVTVSETDPNFQNIEWKRINIAQVGEGLARYSFLAQPDTVLLKAVKIIKWVLTTVLERKPIPEGYNIWVVDEEGRSAVEESAKSLRDFVDSMLRE